MLSEAKATFKLGSKYTHSVMAGHGPTALGALMCRYSPRNYYAASSRVFQYITPT